MIKTFEIRMNHYFLNVYMLIYIHEYILYKRYSGTSTTSSSKMYVCTGTINTACTVKYSCTVTLRACLLLLLSIRRIDKSYLYSKVLVQ